VRVDLARPEEYARVGQVCVEAYRAAGVLGEDDDGYAATMREVHRRAADAVVLVAREGRRAVGTVTLAAPGTAYADLARDDELEVRMLAVDPAEQGRGVAEALLRGAAGWAAEHGYPTLVLSVFSAAGPDTAHRLYERVGYRRVPERDYVGHWDPGATMWSYALDVSAVRI
jgi:GNAT superfamily N-acetyltransferase